MEGRKKTSKKTEVNTLAKVQNTNSDFLFTIKQTLELVQKYFFAYQQPALITKPKSKGRRKTKYTDNVTAALALSTEPKIKIKPCQPKNNEINKPSPVVNSFSLSLYNLFARKPIAPLPEIKKNIILPRAKSVPGIEEKMIKLVEDFNKLKNPRGDDKALAETLLLKQINLVENEIIEHAQRRVDLYFYLLVAVYMQHAIIEKSHTNKQHGAGTNAHGTHAAHDSLFPHIEMKYPRTISNLIWCIFTNLPNIRDTHFERYQ